MISPGVGLIAFFVILPFLSAVILSFTNQRLLSPNPTSYVGLANYKQLLSVGVITIDPERDSNGTVVRDKNGAPKYPRLRNFTRNNPQYPHIK